MLALAQAIGAKLQGMALPDYLFGIAIIAIIWIAVFVKPQLK